MPTPTDFPTGAPLWIDLASSDPKASAAFYSELFGWTATDTGPDFGGYIRLELGDKSFGGIGPNPADAPPESARPDLWQVYLTTDDADTTASAITGAGGMVHFGPQEVGPLGSMLVAEDPGRAIVCAWQRGLNRGMQVMAEAGAPAWFELHTTVYEDSLQFYRQAFGWQTNTMSDSPEFRYTQLMVDEQPYAGVMDATAYWPAGDPAMWVVYIAVADVDGTLARAVELGGAVVDQPEDTPFGRLAAFTDPTGAYLKIVADMPSL
ncbi:VOC family protein [Frondihabitans australicus]|uniref:VOC domain-containing protein n=1 Tax=Frondihabitans australicus TaxID=386892 RepID=A0A495ILV0_9MICO|nr:VOC family protein [Frondihabitans australicus]RKR76105.1 hypothetical protein C8E83_3270 [Frondihabitans australicus]